jgi:myo-inositol-1(or 4)-monophosphatase
MRQKSQKQTRKVSTQSVQEQKGPPPLPALRDLILDAAHASGKVLRRYYRSKLRIQEKPGAGLVTNADLEAQEAAVKILSKGFPLFGFLTEEAKPQKARGPGRWIIDPLDGTTNFVHGFPMFCVSIAAEWDGEIIAGTIYHPILEESYLALKGRGATRNGQKIHVSDTQKIENALLTTGFTYQKEKLLQKEMKAFQKLSGVARAVRRPGSAALDLAYTAAGVFDAFWEQNLSPWDIAAGALIVREAGGRVTNFQNQAFQLSDRALLASNTILHPALLEEINPGVDTRMKATIFK